MCSIRHRSFKEVEHSFRRNRGGLITGKLMRWGLLCFFCCFFFFFFFFFFCCCCCGASSWSSFMFRLWALKRPHLHRDQPIWLNDMFPDRRENYVAVRPNKVV